MEKMKKIKGITTENTICLLESKGMHINKDDQPYK
jgi:hypothetical protein